MNICTGLLIVIVAVAGLAVIGWLVVQAIRRKVKGENR